MILHNVFRIFCKGLTDADLPGRRRMRRPGCLCGSYSRDRGRRGEAA